VPAAAGIGQRNRHLAQRDTVEGAAVLAGRAGAVRRRLRIGGLIDDQHPISVIEMLHGPDRRVVQRLLVIPDRTRQQVLQPVRPAVPDRLSDRPAVVIV